MDYFRALYDWVLSWSQTPYGSLALFLHSFSESSFFPVPPDILLIALSISRPAHCFFFATITSIGSVMGGAFGYLIGYQFMERFGLPILKFYRMDDKFYKIERLYQRYDAWAVAVAGFTPLPYKLFTLAAGACHLRFTVFIIASLLSRGLRFFLVASLIYHFGTPIKSFIDQYFNLLTILFFLLLIVGYLIIRRFYRTA